MTWYFPYKRNSLNILVTDMERCKLERDLTLQLHKESSSMKAKLDGTMKETKQILFEPTKKQL
jgi:hypothetical protein